MRNAIRFILVTLTFSISAVGCVESDDHVDDIDRDRPQGEAQQQETPQESPDNPLGGGPGGVVVDQEPVTPNEGEPNEGEPAEGEPADGEEVDADQQVDADQEQQIRVELLAGKQPNHPSAWLAHAAANESQCGHSSCPFIVEDGASQPASIPPFERAEECMLAGGVAVEGGSSYATGAEAGAAKASFTTDVSSGPNFVELSLSGEATAELPTAGGVRSDAGATLYADETALVLDIENPSQEPIELEVSWDLSGAAERGEASWQGALWYTDNASRLDECYVAPDYQYDRVFDVFQDVGGDVRGEASGIVRLPLAAAEHTQIGLRLNVGAHAVGREGSRPELAQSSASEVAGTLRFQVVPTNEPAE